MSGISELKNKRSGLILLSLLLVSACKEVAPQLQVKEAKTEAILTNIRFATIPDGYQEKKSFDRLTTGKTEITSTQFQMEGPAWENENVAFRNYFDTRNGIDIFGKIKKENVLDSVAINENYHELQNWGMDVLKVGNSLGAGAIGLIIGDSLYRVGPNSEGSFRIISELPKESILEFRFKNWKIKDRNYEVIHTISISAGTHFYSGRIKVNGLKGDELLVTGIVDHEVGYEVLEEGNFKIISTFGAQDVEGKFLGMAVATSTDSYGEYKRAEDYEGSIDHTHLLVMKGNDVQYHFFSGWELENAGFVNSDFFSNMFKSELRALSDQ